MEPNTICEHRTIAFGGTRYTCTAPAHPDRPDDHHFMRTGTEPELLGQEHVVELNHAEACRLSTFAARPNGALTLGTRLVIEAVEGQGLLVRTRPYHV